MNSNKLITVWGFSSGAQKDQFQKDLIVYLGKTIKNSQELIVDSNDSEIILNELNDDEILQKVTILTIENEKYKNIMVKSKSLDNVKRRISFENERTATYNSNGSFDPGYL